MGVNPQCVRLNNAVEMPLLGLGTYPLNGLRLFATVRRAVRIGYRGFDGASAYHNEKWLGRGIRWSGLPRERLFVTTKLSNQAQFRGDVRKALMQSLVFLGLRYVDLYLMHWPVPGHFQSSWLEMEALYQEGLARAIGVCNFHRHHLETLMREATVVPAVNQVELHPLLSQSDVRHICKDLGIQVQAYSPLARMHPRLIGNETLAEIASRHRKSVPQVILRWVVQHGVATVPKTASPVRLEENFRIYDFSLSDGEMAQIDSLNGDFRVRFDPDNCDFTQL